MSIPLEFSTRRWLAHGKRIVRRADEGKKITSREVLIHTLTLYIVYKILLVFIAALLA